MNIYTWGIVISIAVYLAVGSWAGRKVKGLEDYFVAGRQAPTLLLVGTLVASLLSTNAFLAEVGLAYRGFGSLMLILVLVNAVGYVGGALLFGRQLRRSRALTVAEYFGKRFDSRRVQVVAGITIVVGLGAYLVAVTQGAALIITQVSDISYPVAMMITWAGYTIFTLNAGSRGVIITDTMMFLLFTIVAFVALGFIITTTGGWFETINALALYEPKPGIISWHGAVATGASWETPAEGFMWALILGLAWSAVVAVSPWQASRYLMAKNEHTVIRSACGATIALLVLYPALMLSGAAINLINPSIEPAERAILWAASNMMPPIAGVLLMAGIMAAALSSATTFLSLVGFSVSNDIMQHHTTDDVRLLRNSRIAMLVVSLFGLSLAMAFPPKILLITYFAGTVFASSWGPVALMSVWSKRITKDAAFWGIIVGFFGNIIPKVLATVDIIDLPVWADPIVIGALLSTITIVLVSRRGEVTKAEAIYREQLHVVPVAEMEEGLIRSTSRWPMYMIVSGVLMAVLMVSFWVLPYADSMQQSALFSGEMVLALSWGSMLIVIGVLLYRYLRVWQGSDL